MVLPLQKKKQVRQGVLRQLLLVVQPSLLLLLLLLLLLWHDVVVQAQVPGLVYTNSGYDNLRGEDAICWSAPIYYDKEQHEKLHEGHHHHTNETEELATEFELKMEDFNGKQWRNDLVPDFVAGPTTMLGECPKGTAMHLDMFHEQVLGSDKLRTQRFYTYHFTLHLHLHEIRRLYDLTDNAFLYSDKTQGNKSGVEYPQLKIQLQFCPINGNLCSPFVLDGLEEWEILKLAGKPHVHGDNHDNPHDHSKHLVETFGQILLANHGSDENHEGHDHAGGENDQEKHDHDHDENGEEKEEEEGDHEHGEEEHDDEEGHDEHEEEEEEGHDHDHRRRRFLRQGPKRQPPNKEKRILVDDA